MTKEEAIHVINQVRGVITKDLSWMEEATRVVNEAADMAIKALEAQELSNNSPKLDSGNGELATDCISRQTAIKIIKNYCENGCDIAEDNWCPSCQREQFIKLLEALPSAQSEPIRINLNEPIKVKLTDWGKEIYYHQYDRTNQIAGREICKPRFPREDENGYTEFQLWCFIELYGMHMGMTLPNVIEPLEIVYER